MSWPIRYHAQRPEQVQVGDLYPAPWMLDGSWEGHLSAQYAREFAGKRPSLVVRLPGGYDFCIDSRAWRDGVPYGDGWTITGEPPAITLSPSINIGGTYHGWIRDGVITDDCEGRTFAG